MPRDSQSAVAALDFMAPLSGSVGEMAQARPVIGSFYNMLDPIERAAWQDLRAVDA
jgi:hypothetical protein